MKCTAAINTAPPAFLANSVQSDLHTGSQTGSRQFIHAPTRLQLIYWLQRFCVWLFVYLKRSNLTDVIFGLCIAQLCLLCDKEAVGAHEHFSGVEVGLFAAHSGFSDPSLNWISH